MRALGALPDETVIDGEIVALDETGRPSFNALQNLGSSKATLVYYVFDVPVVAGRDVMREPLSARRPPPARDASQCSSRHADFAALFDFQ